jgi:hypothetical protein
MPIKTTVSDITPAESQVHKIVIAPEDVAAFLTELDHQAPAGKLARSIQAVIDPKGQITLTITYQA